MKANSAAAQQPLQISRKKSSASAPFTYSALGDEGKESSSEQVDPLLEEMIGDLPHIAILKQQDPHVVELSGQSSSEYSVPIASEQEFDFSV